MSEKVPPSAMNPQFGDEPTRFECDRFIAQIVNGEIEEFWREGG